MSTVGLNPPIRFAEIKEQSHTPLGCESVYLLQVSQENMGGLFCEYHCEETFLGARH